MNIKLIATDMDGTLLNYDNKISDENTDALLACQQKGIQVMLASGRSYQRLLPYVSQLQLLKYDGMFLEGNGMGLYFSKDAGTDDFPAVKDIRSSSPESVSNLHRCRNPGIF